MRNSNTLLRPMLTKQLRPGARIVSHDFDMDDWEPVHLACSDRFFCSLRSGTLTLPTLISSRGT